ncbi:MAG: cell division protein ZapE [Nitratireductor sp.]
MGPVEKSYKEMVCSGELESDPVQVDLAQRLDALLKHINSNSLAKKSSSLGWLFARKDKPSDFKGLYIWGSVGRGKSMLMDLFYSHVSDTSKRRAHFHEFMSDVQDKIAAHRKAYKLGEVKEEDPIPPIARSLAGEAKVLCFDEFTVTDIADATILGRVFTTLFEEGCMVVATSNVAPDNLYKDGLNRSLFLPFIELFKTKVDIFELDAPKDYRLDKFSNNPVYLAPLSKKSEAAFDAMWQSMTSGLKVEKASIERKGRAISIPFAARGIAKFTFDEICNVPLAAADYLDIAKEYHTFFIEGVPIMNSEMRNQAKRFILLIDALYDQKKRLIISADANPHALCQGLTGTESFEFQRTSSRLIEMQSSEYLAQIEQQ